MDELLIINLWEADLRDQVAPHTASEYRRYIHHHHLRRRLDVPLLEADPLLIKAWLGGQGWAPATRHYALRALGTAAR